MTPFQMNMARGLVLPLAIRKRWHRWLMVYVFVATVACGVAMHQGLDRVTTLNEERIDLSKGEHQFQLKRSGVIDIGAYARDMSARMDECVAKLDAVNRFQTAGHRTTPLLLGLTVALPQGMEIGRFEIGEGREIKFEVLVPVDRRIEESLSPTRLIALWGKDPGLAGRIESFKTENSERVRVGGQTVLNWHFSATLAGEP